MPRLVCSFCGWPPGGRSGLAGKFGTFHELFFATKRIAPAFLRRTRRAIGPSGSAIGLALSRRFVQCDRPTRTKKLPNQRRMGHAP